MYKSLLVAAGLTVAATTAFSGTINFETDEAGFVNVTGDASYNSTGDEVGPFASTLGGITFTIEAARFATGTNISIINDTSIDIRQGVEGLGVDHGFDGGDVDGSLGNDILLFRFSETIRLDQIIFENVDDNDDFVFYMPGADPNFGEFDIVNPLAFPDIDGDEGQYTFLPAYEGSFFGIGAQGSFDNFRVSRLVVSEVPLPAAGWMLLAGLGGMAAMRRRRKAA